jgi:type I restriction enzyme, S subunit
LLKSTSRRNKIEYDYIEISDVNVGDGIATPNKIQIDDLPANAKQEVKHGDIIISKVRPNRGAVAIIDCDDTNLIVSGAFTVLRAKRNSVFLNETLKVLLRLPIYRDWMLKFNVGTQYPVIQDEDILNLSIPLIDESTQNRISDLVQQSFRLKKQSADLLIAAKHAVEIAIEQDEHTAIMFLENFNIGQKIC